MAASQKDDPPDFSLGIHALGFLDFVVLFPDVIRKEPQPRFLYPGLQQFQQAGEEQVVPPPDDDRYRLRGKLLEVFGVYVGLVAHPPDHLHDPLPGCIVYVRTLVEHTGNGADAYPGEFCDLLDCNACIHAANLLYSYRKRFRKRFQDVV